MFNSALLKATGLRVFTAAAIVVSGLAPALVTPAASREGDRTLRLYHTHTRESGEFTFKRGGRYDKGALDKLNHFLRDWRTNEPTRMDPQLFDLVWGIQQQVGARQPIHIVSSYRSLKTNNMLRERSRGVAKKSQHTAGKAMDFFIPGVPLAKLRAAALKLQVGGVGYYPSSGSPFVHADTGSVRMWPRMSRQQLASVFPNGETLYIPADGKPLSGFAAAQAKYGKSKEFALASLDSKVPSSRSAPRVGGEKPNAANWLKTVFSDEDDADEEGVAPAPPARTAPVPVPAPAVAQEEAVLVAAAEPASEPSLAPLPKARPGAAAEPLAAPAEPVAAEAIVLADAGAVPLPRVKPQAAGEAPAYGSDSQAIVDLATRMEASTPESPDPLQLRGAASAEVAVASLVPLPKARPGSRLDPSSAVAAANELGRAGKPADALPQARPSVQLAYAEAGDEVSYETAYGGRYADVPPAGAPKATPLPLAAKPAAPRSTIVPKQPVVASLAPAPARPATPHPATRVEQALEVSIQGDDENLKRLMSQLTTRSNAFAKLARPQPPTDGVLFTAPDAATSAPSFSGTSIPRGDRFSAPAPVAAAAPEPGLIERLFATF